MDDYNHQISVRIAQTLEKLHGLDPDLYALRYSELYPLGGNADPKVWTVEKLHRIEQDLTNIALLKLLT
jgi:hypothetical protein